MAGTFEDTDFNSDALSSQETLLSILPNNARLLSSSYNKCSTEKSSVSGREKFYKHSRENEDAHLGSL